MICITSIPPIIRLTHLDDDLTAVSVWLCLTCGRRRDPRLPSSLRGPAATCVAAPPGHIDPASSLTPDETQRQRALMMHRAHLAASLPPLQRTTLPQDPVTMWNWTRLIRSAVRLTDISCWERCTAPGIMYYADLDTDSSTLFSLVRLQYAAAAAAATASAARMTVISRCISNSWAGPTDWSHLLQPCHGWDSAKVYQVQCCYLVHQIRCLLTMSPPCQLGRPQPCSPTRMQGVLKG